MNRERKAYLLLAITGGLFMLTGIRDLLWPGFLALSRNEKTAVDIAISLIVGAFFLGLAWRQDRKYRKDHPAAHF